MAEDPMLDPSEARSGARDVAPSADAHEEEFSFWRWLGELVVLVGVAFIVAWGIKSFIVQPFYIPSGSMEPTLMPGDRILVSKFIYRFDAPKRDDIIVFIAPGDQAGRDFVKRIVGLPGETVEGRRGTVFVNGKPLREPYVSPVPDTTSWGPVKIPPRSYFVMGDNRMNSSDSRVFGPLARSAILGKAFIIYWPLTLEPGQHRLL